MAQQIQNAEYNENQEEEIYSVENPTLDINVYAQSYTGFARLHRLIYIADHCPSLRIIALKDAIDSVTTTDDTRMYQLLHKKFANINVTGNGELSLTAAQLNLKDMPSYDPIWVEIRTKKAAFNLKKLENELSNYESNSIKESIRRCHEDLGDHYLSCGDLSNALKCYVRARDYCSSAEHTVNMCLNVIQVSITMRKWSDVSNYVTYAMETAEAVKYIDQNRSIFTKLKCAAGLAALAITDYKSAAEHFLDARFDHCTFPEMISPNNVAMYGGLCALATFDREQMQKSVSSSSPFKVFLALEPQLAKILYKFYECNYAAALNLLYDIRDNLLLDVYIAPHVNALYSDIRNRAMNQYLFLRKKIGLYTMAAAFNVTVFALEIELQHLIQVGKIQAKIDSNNKILNMDIDSNQRVQLFQGKSKAQKRNLRLKLKKEFQTNKAAMQPIAPALKIEVQPSPRFPLKKTISRHWNQKVENSNIWIDAGQLPNYERIRLHQEKRAADSLGNLKPASSVSTSAIQNF